MKRLGSVILCAAAMGSPLPSTAQSNSIPCGTPYAVSPGDTLSIISTRAYGVSAFEIIYDANRDAIGDNPNLLFVGQRLNVPCRGDAPTARVEPIAVAPTPQAEPDAEAPAPTDAVILTFNRTSDLRFVINTGIIDPYLSAIELATEGRVLFVDPPEMNRDPEAQFDLVRSGEVDGTYVLNNYVADVKPLLQVPMIPLMGGSAQQTAVSMWNLHDRYLSSTNYFEEAHVLGFISAPAAHIWRRLDNPVRPGENVFSANVYPVPYFEGLDTIGPQQVQALNAERFGTHDELQDGMLTFLMAHGAARGAGIWNADRGVTEVENGLYTPTYTVVLSNDAWGRISPRDQEIINGLSGLALSQRSAAWDTFDNSHRGWMLENGLDVAYPNEAVMAELENISESWLKAWSRTASNLGVDAEAAIADYRADLLSLQYLLIYR